jgi:diadenosine tetraphosphate (Ap4A) HIT family hydrolase
MFELDAQLQRDCFVLGRLDFCQLLLMNNAGVPWFILVPETTLTETFDLDASRQAMLQAEINALAAFVRASFITDKLNIATIGNIVRQLHVHVVGRRQNDYCWPGVVWGTVPPERYTDEQLAQIRTNVAHNLKGFRA